MALLYLQLSGRLHAVRQGPFDQLQVVGGNRGRCPFLTYIFMQFGLKHRERRHSTAEPSACRTAPQSAPRSAQCHHMVG